MSSAVAAGANAQQQTASPANPQQSGAPAVVTQVPFGRAGKESLLIGSVKSGVAFGDSFTLDVPTQGFLKAICLIVDAAGGVNGTETVAVKEDAPWNAVKTLELDDPQGKPINVYSGFNAHLAREWGGYQSSDAKSKYAFTAPSVGASGTGNFHMEHWIYQGFGRDDLGVLPNSDANAAYRLLVTMGAAADVYSTAPGTLPTMTVTIVALVVNRPTAQTPPDQNGQSLQQATQPPSPGAIQYWTVQSVTLAAGDSTPKMIRVGKNIRNIVLIFRDTSGSRAGAESTVVPSSIRLQWDTQNLFNTPVEILRQQAYEVTGVDAEDGVIPILLSAENGKNIGNYGLRWIPTTGATLLQFEFIAGAAGSLLILTNDCQPGAGDMFAAPAAELVG